MTKENQKKLYDHYMNISVNGMTEKQRDSGKERAADILKSFPDFAKKSEKPVEKEEEKPVEKVEENKSEEAK